MAREIFIAGCGYTGFEVARREQERGGRVRALTRSLAGAERLRTAGIEPVSGDLDDPASLTALSLDGVLIYYFAPPPARGVDDPRLRALLDAIRPHARPHRVVLLSTTGVYGDCGGMWIDEERPPNPQTDRARRRLAAEQRLHAWAHAHGVSFAILRVAGIYGPGRLPIQRLQQGSPVLREAESPWSNRVHVDDLVAACLAAVDHRSSGRIYNISDGHPTTMTDYFNSVADACGLPRPPQISMAQAQTALSAEMLSYLAESRRLDNTRMRTELGVILRYPTLLDGLRVCTKPIAGQRQ
jgi:nucleoside-diphosphate-sugar epimerase